MSKKTRLAIAAAVAALLASQTAGAATFAKAGTFRRSVQLFYAANNTVQTAVDKAICKTDSMIDKPMSAYGLHSRRDVKTANAILASLADVFDKSAGTDSALEQINADFCKAADSR